MIRFALSEEAAFQEWLVAKPRSIVLLRGVGCPYSAAFETAFAEEPAPEGWALAVREVEEGGDGPVAEALKVEVTPSVAAFTFGEAAARLPGKVLLGITRVQYRRFLRELR